MTLKQLYTMNLIDVLVIVMFSPVYRKFLFMLVLLERSYRKVKGLLFIVLEVIAFVVIMMGGMYVIETLDIFLSQEISAIMIAIFVSVLCLYDLEKPAFIKMENFGLRRTSCENLNLYLFWQSSVS